MDPTTIPALRKAIELIKAGDRQQASIILAQFIKSYPQNEQAWHLLSYAVKDQGQQIYALERALAINPANKHAKSRLMKIAPLRERSIGLGTESAPNTSPEIAVHRDPPREIETPKQSDSQQSITEITTGITTYGLWHRIRTRLIISWRSFKLNWSIFSRSRLALLGLVLIAFFGLMAVAHPILMNTVWPSNIYDPDTGFDMDIFIHPAPPGEGHILGTDTLGRDVLSMLLAATTPTFVIGLTAAMTTALVGTILSVAAAYFRGAVDTIIVNIADVILLFPAPIMLVIIGARFRDLGPFQLGLIYGCLTGAGATTLVMRTHALQIVSRPFMEAARLSGGGAMHIIVQHIIPFVLPLAALQMMIAVTGAVVADGFISFFGLTRTVSNWGTLIYDSFVYRNITGGSGTAWHMLIPAAACFSLFALGFYLVSRGLHRVASPRLREEF